MMRCRHIILSVLLLSLTLVASCGEEQAEVHSEGPPYVEYLRADNYSKLVMEIDSVATAAPDQNAQAHVQAVLSELLDKPGGVEIVRDQVLDSRGSQYSWTLEELGVLVSQSFDLEVEEGVLKMHAVFLDGSYAGDSGDNHILGLAWGDYRHFVIFKEKLKELCSTGIYANMTSADGQALCENSESAVWLHEVGHLLGLVNKGVASTSDHEDKDHPGHTKSEESVMHWSYELSASGSGIMDQIYKRIMVGRTEPLDFGASCEADLAAVREAP